MLQLKELRLIRDLTGSEAYENKAVTFGITFPFTAAVISVLASQFVPENMALLVTRVQCYLTNTDNTATDYLNYRVHPDGVAFWILATSITDTTGVYFVTPPTAAAHLILDTDKFLLFPPGMYANLLFTPNAVPPATGTWEIRTTVFSYFVPPKVYEQFSGPMEWVNIQS